MPFSTKIARSSAKEYKFAAAAAKFGATFELSRPAGINNFSESLSIVWVNLSKADKISLEFSIKSGGSWQIYSYQPCYDTVSKNFRLSANSFKADHTGNATFSATATFNQVFDIT